jgi:hypothetical protein
MLIECRCGAVAVDLSGGPIAQFYCHCADCQAVHGAAFVPVALYRAPSVSITRGELQAWALRTTPRRTCARCGTRMFAEPNPQVRGVMATLLPLGAFKAGFHIHCASALLPIRDDLPHYATLPAKMGGTDALVDW